LLFSSKHLAGVPLTQALGDMKLLCYLLLSTTTLVALSACSTGTTVAEAERVQRIYVRELPPPELRNVVGKWRFDDICTGSIVIVDPNPYWVTDCMVSTGPATNTYGIMLRERRGGHYLSAAGGMSFFIQADGSLIQKVRGQPEIHAISIKN
jgi:hypothetical protein